MADRLDLSGDIAAAVDGAAARGSALVLGYIGDDGLPGDLVSRKHAGARR
jgi:hypothetical protein